MQSRGLAPLVALLLLPTAQAWTDGATDHEVSYLAAGGVDPQWVAVGSAGWYPALDLVRAEFVGETPEHVILEFEVGSLDTGVGEPEEFEAFDYVLDFTLKGEPRRAVLTYSPVYDFTFFTLQHPEPDVDGDIRWQWDMSFPVEPLADAPGWRVLMDKMMVRDSTFVPIREGDVFSDVTGFARDSEFVYSFSYYAPCMDIPPSVDDPFNGPDRCGWRGRDVVGDGGSLGSFELTQSPEGLGHLFLRVPEPFRGSNGLATTYLYELVLHNLGTTRDRAFLQLGDVPAGWEIRMPAVVDLAPEDQKTIPVAVTVPFKHGHGDVEMAQIRVVSESNSEVGAEAVIGVIFTDPPQPAGHHNTLHLHSSGSGWGWMNVNPVDEEADDTTLIGPNYSYSSIDPAETPPGSTQLSTINMGFHISLQPGLFTGLDFDLGRNVATDIAFQSLGDAEGQWEASLNLVNYREETSTVLATIAPQALSLAAGSPVVVTGEMAMEPAADRIPFQEWTNLELQVWFNGTTDPLTRFTALAGSFQDRSFQSDISIQPDRSNLVLPLIDYHDAVPQEILDSLAALTLSNITANFKELNPGRAAAYAFDAGNLDSSTHDVSWSVSGGNADWASVYPDRSTIVPGRNATVVVAVVAPEGAKEGDVAELILVGRSEQDPDMQVFAKVVAYVTTTKDIPDESGLVDELRSEAAKTKAKPTPGIGLAVVAVALLALALQRRRHG